MKPLLIIWIGGGIGSVLRYLAQINITKQLPGAFPSGTLLVNIIGCFLIGLFYALSNKYNWLTVDWRLFLITGLCGGFTTFSTFSYEGVSLFKQGNYTYFLLYVLSSVIVGLLATVAGSAIVK